MIDIIQLKNKVQKRVTERDLLQFQLTKLQDKKKKLKIQVIRKERALEFIKDVALKTQNQLEYHISDMVSAGLNTVMDEEYNFKVIFEIKRGRTECKLMYEKENNLIDPLNFSGIGAADVSAFCLRCAGYSMNPVYRNVFILDEPFKHLSIDLHEKTSELIKMLSEKLGIQIIIISHSEIMTKQADKIFRAQMKNGETKVIEIEN